MRVSICLIFLTLLVLTSCRREESGASPVTESVSPAAQAPPVVEVITDSSAPQPVDTVISLEQKRFFESAAIGTALSEDESISKRGDRFSKGQALFVSVRAREAPKGLVARTVISTGEGKELDDQQKTVEGAMRWTSLQHSTKGLAPGEYTVVIYLGGNRVQSEPFTIE